MTDPSTTTSEAPPLSRPSRQRRREAIVNTLAAILGCLALVVMIATVFRVITAKLWESTQVNPDYVDSVYEDVQGRGWSGNTTTYAPLIAGEGDVQPRDTPMSVENAADALRAESKAAPVIVPATPAPATLAGTAIGAVKAVNGISKIESKRTEIEAVVRGFFEADSIDLKLIFARDPVRVRPLMENYYKSHPMQIPLWKNLGFVMTVDEPGHRFGYAQAVFENADPMPVVIEETEDGRYRVDWESIRTIGYGELDWNEFLKVRPAEPTLLRVTASKPKIDPVNPPPQGHDVIEIQKPGQEGTLLAYFDRNDPKFRPLLDQLQSGKWLDVPLTLRLCFPGPSSAGSPSTGASVANIEGKGWLILKGTRS